MVYVFFGIGAYLNYILEKAQSYWESFVNNFLIGL